MELGTILTVSLRNFSYFYLDLFSLSVLNGNLFIEGFALVKIIN